MILRQKQQCRCCKDNFTPDYRNAGKQEYCGKTECRKASKAVSQKRWSDKNPGYFKGQVHVDRVRDWRKANPGYRDRKKPEPVLQDDFNQIPVVNQPVTPVLPSESQISTPVPPVLQDFCLSQHPVIIGLIAHFTGYVLQDEIDVMARRLEQLGNDVISKTGGRYDPQIPNLSRSHPHCSRTVQLGGSPSGP